MMMTAMIINNEGVSSNLEVVPEYYMTEFFQVEVRTGGSEGKLG